MVGRQTSRGCSTCRKRKTKCDLAVPACSNCVNAGWACPGYPDRFINAFQAASKVHKSPSKSNLPPRYSNEALPITLISEADSLRLEFLWKLEGDILAARLAMMPTGNVLKHIPRHIGYSQALDDAVKCIAQGPESLSNDGFFRGSKLYGKALRSLANSLNSSGDGVTPGTLAAASLLQMYGQYVKPTDQVWTHHTLGILRMLQLRGIENLTDDVERAVLQTQVGNTFMSAITNNQECFLTHPAWSRVLTPPMASKDEALLDNFMRMIVDGLRPPDIDALCSPLVLDCKFTDEEKLLRPQRWEAVMNTNLAKLGQMRERLTSHLDSSSTFLGGNAGASPVMTVAYAAAGLFLLVTDTILLGMYRQIQQTCGNPQPRLPSGLSIESLTIERSRTLDSVTARFQFLRISYPGLHYTALRALRMIIGTMLGLIQPKSHDEAEVLLLVLSQELSC